MGFSMITALEIFTNPGDLEIVITQDEESAKFAVGIFRGPGHNFKPIITSPPFVEKLEDAVEVIRKTLESICENMTKEFADSESMLSQWVNTGRLQIDKSKVLSSDLIGRILEELRQGRVASTCKMLAPVG